MIAGQALRRWGRHAQARVQLTAAVTVLRADLDADTVRALGELAAPEVHAGSADADALSAEALALGQDLAVDEATLAGLFDTRGLFHSSAGRNPQAAVYHQASARLAGQAGDPVRLGRALLNLSDAVIGTDPAADADSLADIEVLACYRAWAAACAAIPSPPRRPWQGWATCGQAKPPRIRRSSPSRRRSLPPRSASPPVS